MAKKPVVPCREAGGFSLIELVTVLMVAFAFAVLILPALGRAGANDNKAVCAANLRKISVAIENYASSWGFFPPTNLNPDSADWAAGSPGWHVHLITGKTNYSVEPGEDSYGLEWDDITCPSMHAYAISQGVSERAVVPQTSYYRTSSHYGYNIRVGGWPGNIYEHSRIPSPKAALDHPAETVLITDSWRVGKRPFYRINPRYTEAEAHGVVWPVHDSGANVLWADGHVNLVQCPDADDWSKMYDVLSRHYWEVKK